MASEFIGFRAHYRKDADILEALGNVKDRTKEIKRLIRLGMAISKGQLQLAETKLPPSVTPLHTTHPVHEKDILTNIMEGFV